MSVEEQSVLLERAESARERAQALVSARADLLVRHRRTMSACLITRTAVIDASWGVTEQRTRDLNRLSALVGRDPSIEAAKAVIADRYGVTRGEAFELLRHMSQTGNRKLRDVARSVLQDQRQTPA
jgi:AmiR/NasT family two-component response regulator